MNILVFNGSPKKQRSDTLHLSRAFLDGMCEAAPQEIHAIDVIDRHIEFCRGCFACKYNGGHCVLDDDMREILGQIPDSDLLLFSYPLYCYGMPAMLKNLVDRMLPLSSMAMEDYALDIMIGKGPSARSIRLDLPKFTLIGATTRAGMLTSPLRDRFGISFRLELYTPEELAVIVKRSAQILKIHCEDDGALEIARRSRGTPRIANRLIRRVRDFAEVKAGGVINMEVAKLGLDMLEVDRLGLDRTDRAMLTAMIKKFGGGPVGLDTLAASTGEDAATIEDVYEPYLLQLGFLMRTPRGRVCTPAAYQHLGYAAPARAVQPDQISLDL